MVHIQYKALALLIRNFLETALIPKFQTNHYHAALYLWNVENRRDITCPPMSPFYDSNFFDSIRKVKNEGILNLGTMTVSMWYRVLMEENITHQVSTSRTVPKASKIELKHPQDRLG